MLNSNCFNGFEGKHICPVPVFLILSLGGYLFNFNYSRRIHAFQLFFPPSPPPPPSPLESVAAVRNVSGRFIQSWAYVQLSELSQYDDSNVLTHGGLANRKKRGRRPLDMPDDKSKVGFIYVF